MRPTRPQVVSSAFVSGRVKRLTLLLAVVTLAVTTPFALRAAARLQGADEVFMPSLQADLRYDTSDAALTDGVILGQEGFGATTVEAQNLSDWPNEMTLDLVQQTGGEPSSLSREVEPLSVARFGLESETSLEGGYYAGRLSGSEELGAIARIRWPSGATAAYEAAPAGRDFIVPIVARAVYSHTSIIYAQNAGTADEDNAIPMVVYDRDDGGVLASTTCNAHPGENCLWDTSHSSWVFGQDLIGSNAPTGGWLGHVWISASQAAAVMAYGDEMAAQGTSAYVGRGVSAAATVQYAPLIRCNYGGDSLIGIANAHDRAVDVTVEYHGAAFSASGAGQTFSQTFSIPRRGSAFVDLSERGRGSRPSPGLPRGTTADSGFIGSAVITASGPVLAVVQDEQMTGGTVDSVSAYNAYGPGDLGTGFGVTGVRKAVGYQSSSLLVYNPDSETIEVTAKLYDDLDEPAGEVTTRIPGRDLVRVALADAATFQPGVGRAIVQGTGTFAALVYDERDEHGEPLEKSTTAYIASIGEGPVSGAAKFVEAAGSVRVDLTLSWTLEGFAYYAEIASGTCDGTRTTAYDLEDPVDRQSTTYLRGIGLSDLTSAPHCVVISVQGFPGRDPRDVACGMIPPLPGPEVVDTALSWPVRMEAARPPASATPPGPSPTAAGAGTATPGAGPWARSVYMPVAQRH
jgi:hypothetical protein